MLLVLLLRVDDARQWPMTSMVARILRRISGTGSCGTWQLVQIARTPLRLVSWMVPWYSA